MKKTTYVVQIIQTTSAMGEQRNEGGEINGAFLESLRYAGLIHVYDDLPSATIDTASSCLIEILPPHGVNDKVWAEQNVKRMKTFGFIAQIGLRNVTQ